MSQARGYLFLHGWQNRRPPGHWQRYAAEALAADGATVRYPQLPDPDEPVLAGWTATARAELAELGDGERIVVCHSLSCLLWAHLAPQLELDDRADRVAWVAPPGPSLFESEPAIATFAPDRLNGAGITASSRAAPLRLVCSDADPYCPEGAREIYGDPLGLDVDLLPGQAHLNLDAGYGEWPSMLAWCRDGAVRLRAR